MGRVHAWLAKHTSASSGSSETEQRALAVIPPLTPAPALVITATPVAKRPNASRNSSGSRLADIADGYIGWSPDWARERSHRIPAPASLVAAVGGRSRFVSSSANVTSAGTG